jgi:hypothetical protein
MNNNNSLIWIIVLIWLFCGCNGNSVLGNLFGGCNGNNDSCTWIIILILLFCCCGNTLGLNDNNCNCCN